MTTQRLTNTGLDTPGNGWNVVTGSPSDGNPGFTPVHSVFNGDGFYAFNSQGAGAGDQRIFQNFTAAPNQIYSVSVGLFAQAVGGFGPAVGHSYRVEIVNTDSNTVVQNQSGFLANGNTANVNFNFSASGTQNYQIRIINTDVTSNVESTDLNVTSASIIGPDPLAPNFIVEGTGGDDLIDANYLGDPQGERVDNGDAQNGSDDDLITAGTGNDTIIAGLGNDSAFGGDGNDNISGEVGNDTLFGGGGEDTIDGGVGNDVINAGGGNDIAFGGLGNDTVRGGAGDDSIEGNDGNDSLEGDSNNDTLFGGAGDDRLDGGSNNDTLFGGDGNDRLDGDANFDTLFGGDGDDTLTGGENEDQLTGGLGNDDFIYNESDGADTITDFNFGNTGSIRDGDQTNNDFIDLAPFYNDTVVANANAAGGNFKNPLSMLQRDAADGMIDGEIEGLDFSAQTGEINLTILDTTGNPVVRPNLTFDNTNVACFCRGTEISTILGPKRVEHLALGDLVLTLDNGYQPLRLVLGRKLAKPDLDQNPKLRPIRISKGALGDNLPEADLSVSRQHRFLVRSDLAADMFGADEVLIAAIKLTDLPGIDIDETVDSVEFFHLIFDRHQIVFSNGSPSESFYPGPESVKTLSREAYEEFVSIFSTTAIEQMYQNPARMIPSGRQQKQLMAKHKVEGKPCLDMAF